MNRDIQYIQYNGVWIAEPYELQKLIEAAIMYRKILLIAFAAFTIAQATPTLRDALDDAFEDAQRFYEQQKEIGNTLSAEANKSAALYLIKARNYSAEYASLLHSRISQSAEHYNATGSQCLAEESRIDRIYEEYLNETENSLQNVTAGVLWGFNFYVKIATDEIEFRRESAKNCYSLESEAAISECRKGVLDQFSGEFDSLKEPMANIKFMSELYIYNLNTYYPVSEIVSLTEYDERALQIALFITNCIALQQ